MIFGKRILFEAEKNYERVRNMSRRIVPYGLKHVLIVKRLVQVTDIVDAVNIAIIIAIWYFIASSGDEPPIICPVIIPGKKTMPMVAILAIVGFSAEATLSRKYGNKASILVAPVDSM